MVRLIRFVLSVIVGGVVGFVLMLISTGIFELVCCGLAALLIGGIVYGVTSGLKGLNLVLAVAAGIAGFVAYAYLLAYLDESAMSMFWALLIGFAPFCLMSWLLFEGAAMGDDESN